ncbi:LOW QUALITY PROTEIN: peroxisomal membrane protein PEX16-like [Haliotis rubra]|uniref:LOW QUALITY PROTEIN: peroxisomal membrane protein PEX16-like n=1 Tax=Haliotis rubra TaxID=36100 RepID=UPI001EE61A5B|nr:LOW QUALITY PROTEIN: peroxisomal membrane protein PEX16-like [Haliotis rubra]
MDMSELLKNVCEKYKRSVRENPDTVGQVETTFRLLSYVIAGRLRNAQVLSELMYTSSNLLVFLNDAILKQTAKIIPKVSASQEPSGAAAGTLTVLEYVEVFVEVAANKLWGEVGKWIVIATIQICKATLRFYLLATYKHGIQPMPPIAPLDRQLVSKKNKEAQQLTEQEDSRTWRSWIQKWFYCSHDLHLETVWESHEENISCPSPGHEDMGHPHPDRYPCGRRKDLAPTPLSRQRVWAETLHIVKPIVHLMSMYGFGLSSWKPWLISCGMDISSLTMMGDPADLNQNEKGELRRRTFMLLYYLLRSPFYDRYSQAKIIFLMKILADNIPGTSLLIRPLLAYLPTWQKVYFYVWSA